jgi:hypothetical protein
MDAKTPKGRRAALREWKMGANFGGGLKLGRALVPDFGPTRARPSLCRRLIMRKPYPYL